VPPCAMRKVPPRGGDREGDARDEKGGGAARYAVVGRGGGRAASTKVAGVGGEAAHDMGCFCGSRPCQDGFVGDNERVWAVRRRLPDIAHAMPRHVLLCEESVWCICSTRLIHQPVENVFSISNSYVSSSFQTQLNIYKE
jgi:hypothetical protein